MDHEGPHRFPQELS